MIKIRQANQCGSADYGWLQARYSFSFGHYFDPELFGFKTLRVLNQEVLAPGHSFQAKIYPNVDIVNIILQGRAEYRDSLGHKAYAEQGECLRFSPQPGIHYSEHNCGTNQLTRLQLWINACPQKDYHPPQKITFDKQKLSLIASPQGEQGSLIVRQNIWIHHIHLAAGEHIALSLNGKHGYLQSIQGPINLTSTSALSQQLHCGDGVFLHHEPYLSLTAKADFQGLLIDLAE